MKLTLTFLLLLIAFGSYASASDLNDDECGQIYVSASKAGGKLNAQEVINSLMRSAADISLRPRVANLVAS